MYVEDYFKSIGFSDGNVASKLYIFLWKHRSLVVIV